MKLLRGPDPARGPYVGHPCFKLMFGRDVQPEYLLNLTKFQYNAINILEDDEEKELNNTEKIERFDEIGNIQNQFHERINDNLNQRESNLDMARRSIEKEQLRQKNIFDKKVVQNRYTLTLI